MNSNNVSTSKVSDSSSLDDILSGSDIKASDIIDRVEYNENMKYHEFEDTTHATHDYDESDDGSDEQEWFAEHSNYDELVAGMSDLERDDFRDWTRGHFMRGQQYRPFDDMSTMDQRLTKTYDKYLDQSVTDEGITLSRRATAELLGLNDADIPTIDQLKRMKGKVVVSKGSMSTAAAKDGLVIASEDSEKPIEYKIHIPAGAKGAGMWLGDKQINGWGPRQREYMTNRDSVYVIGDSKTKKTKFVRDWWTGKTQKIPVQEVHLYYIGRLPHDYGEGYNFK